MRRNEKYLKKKRKDFAVIVIIFTNIAAGSVGPPHSEEAKSISTKHKAVWPLTNVYFAQTLGQQHLVPSRWNTYALRYKWYIIRVMLKLSSNCVCKWYLKWSDIQRKVNSQLIYQYVSWYVHGYMWGFFAAAVHSVRLFKIVLICILLIYEPQQF